MNAQSSDSNTAPENPLVLLDQQKMINHQQMLQQQSNMVQKPQYYLNHDNLLTPPMSLLINERWTEILREIQQTSQFKNQELPLARIKKIMKSNPEVRMISAEAPVLFAKACEMFIVELSVRSWAFAEQNKRRTLQKSDISAAIQQYPLYEYITDLFPLEPNSPTHEATQQQSVPQNSSSSTIHPSFNTATINNTNNPNLFSQQQLMQMRQQQQNISYPQQHQHQQQQSFYP